MNAPASLIATPPAATPPAATAPLPARPARPALDPHVIARVTPVSQRRARSLPLPDALSPLFPGGVLRRGTAVAVTSAPGATGATTLALSLLSAVSTAGSWCALVGLDAPGLAAATMLGLRLERTVLVPRPGARWAEVAATVADAADVVLLQPPRTLKPAMARRLDDRIRRQGAVLVVLARNGGLGPAWPGRADLRLTITKATWEGAGDEGPLRARCAEIVSEGRGEAGRARHHLLWLPGPAGRPGLLPAVAPAMAAAGGGV